jgi:predicted acylesterase/phospholipase RssA
MPAPRPRRKRKPSKIALVCAGGGVTGAVYEIGCLRALDDLIEGGVGGLDLYVGVSGGALVSALLAAGITPAEMYDAVASPAGDAIGMAEAPLYRLGVDNLVTVTRRAPAALRRALGSVLTGETRSLADFASALFELLPPGLLENTGVQEYVAALVTARAGADRFDRLARPLLVVAVDLDSAEAVAFGDAAHRNVPVSKAVQASTALPGLYRPVRIRSRDYVDGGVKKTAHIHLAIESGADLVLCVNPIVPIHNDVRTGPWHEHLSGKGIAHVLDQVLRIVLHGRMQYGLERYAKENPGVDILLVEPARDDVRMFSYHIMRYGARRIVAEHGYQSVMSLFDAGFERYRRMLARHGLRLRHPRTLPAKPEAPRRSTVGRRLASSLRELEKGLDAPRRAARRAAR